MGRLGGVSLVLHALGGCSAPSPAAWLPRGLPCRCMHLVQCGIGQLQPFASPTVPLGRHKGHWHGTWCSHACYKLMDPDVPTGFSYMSTGRLLRSRDRQTWQHWPSRVVWVQCRLGQPTGGDKGFIGPCGSLAGLCMVGCSPKAMVAQVGWWRGQEPHGCMPWWGC